MDVKRLKKLMRSQGYTFEITNGGHIAWKDPSGRTVAHSPATGSDTRGIHNLIGDLRRAGAHIPRKGSKLVTRQRREES